MVLHDEAILKAVAQEKPQLRARSCIFCSSHTSSSSLSGLLAPLPVCLSGLPPLYCHCPRLLPLLFVMGRGRNFEGLSPPSQQQVGGILGWHWHAWQSFGADE